MAVPFLRLVLPAFLLCAGVAGHAHGQAAFLRPVLLRLADADGDGAIDQAEWQAFLEGVADGAGGIDMGRLKALLVLSSLEEEKGGGTTREALAPLFDEADRDGDGVVRRNELGGLGRRGREGAASDPFAGLARGVVLLAADASGDGQVTRREWERFLAALPEGPVDVPTVVSWVRAAEAEPPAPEDRPGAFTPGVFLLTVQSVLDFDQDGAVTPADFRLLFEALDRDGDGRISAEELARPVEAPARTGAGAPARGGAFAVDPARRVLPATMPWQRSLEDALALVEATGMPLLVVVNLDGESASEALSWGRYREEAFAALASGFACVLASPNRRNPRDHDDFGRRLVDHRFGRLVDGELLANEPLLFQRYFGGRRVAPRHIGLAPDGTVLFDISLTWTHDPIDAALAEHGRPDLAPPPAERLGEEELLASPDAGHREALEARWLSGDEETRVRLAGAALDASRSTQHPEILRMALRDPNPAVRRAAVRAAAVHPGAVPPDLLPETVARARELPGLAGELLDGLSRADAPAGDGSEALSPTAYFARLLDGLTAPSSHVRVERWRLALLPGHTVVEAAATGEERDALEARMDALEARLRETPEDGGLWLVLAATTVRHALANLELGRNPTFFLEDARAAAKRALEHGASPARAHALAAWANRLLGDWEAAQRHSESALPLLLQEAEAPLAARALEAFASCRARALFQAMDEGAHWPPSWVADLRAAHEVLLEHPAAGLARTLEGIQWFQWLEARAEQADLIRRALRRWPHSEELHAWLRAQVLRDQGAGALLAFYDEPPPPDTDGPTWEWFAGLAAVLAAERHEENRNTAAAKAAYDLALGRFRLARAENPDFAESCAHYIALAQEAGERLAAGATEPSAQGSARGR